MIAPGNGSGFGSRVEDLAWIEEFARSVAPHVRLRREDGVLIKVPLEVHRVNPEGLDLLDRALRGETAARIVAAAGAEGRPERIFAIHAFFCDVRDLLRGRLGDGTGRVATRRQRFKGTTTRYPVLAEIALTYRCNLACSFCYAGCGTPDAPPGNAARERRPFRIGPRRVPRDPAAAEMTTEEALRVVDEIAGPAKVPSVSFTGGEATLRPDLPRLIARARERGMRVNLITNGIRCAGPDYVARLVDAGLHSAQVSLEGPTPEIHDGLTQSPGSFARTLRGLENLARAGLSVHTHTTISRGNAPHLEAIVDLVADLGLPRVSMNQVIPTGTPGLARNAGLRVRYSEIGEHVLRVKRRADERGIRFHWYSPTPLCVFNPIAHGLGNKGCAACDGLLHVNPAGEVLPCSSFAGSVGNILEDGFERVWRGRDARWYRMKRQAPLVCRTCEDFALCQGACTLYWTGVGTRELYPAFAKKTLLRRSDDAARP